MGSIWQLQDVHVWMLQGRYVAVLAQWIRPQTLSHEVPGLNLLAAAVVLLGKALYPHCLVPWKGLKAVGPHGCSLINS